MATYSNPYKINSVSACIHKEINYCVQVEVCEKLKNNSALQGNNITSTAQLLILSPNNITNFVEQLGSNK